ncbi:hypothetical protein ACIRP7_23015 [Streptomyces sp. NPDC102270]|uniref:hypothetical protein n=1 Tax=Streptomyces sp. NPDC102270 TaxID=3366150 RepID=UPI0038126D6A
MSCPDCHRDIHAQAPPTATKAAVTASKGAVKSPDATLGKGWKTSGDRAVTSAADSDGLHLLVADSKDAYAWKTVTVLSEPQLPADTWIGNSCVHAPRTFTSKPDLRWAARFAWTPSSASTCTAPPSDRSATACESSTTTPAEEKTTSCPCTRR